MNGMTRIKGFPVDLSGSLSTGNVLPTRGFTQGVMGVMDPMRATARTAEDFLGVTGGAAGDLFRSTMRHDGGLDVLRQFLPNVVSGAIDTTSDVMEGEFRTRDGKALVPIDLHNPFHVMDVVNKYMGFNPQRISIERDAKFAHYEDVRYYEGRRELALVSMTAALKVPEGQKPDPKKVAAAIAALKRFNNEAPPQFRWDKDQWYKAVKGRMENRAVEAMGFPTQMEYLELSEARRKAYGLPPAGTPGAAMVPPRPQAAPAPAR
jgi:hypothetical protein